ncbi:MAG: hypothetical protein E6275_06785 [Veillonella sp.]|jgi:hypothetical protein|uniref:hypothetical protein n=1 Tax=Veillonella sp. TaxID=1926307 RepID=UPI00290C471A|nr:hypothetical protein [Veillonella sp.]MDU7211827.1 hypothetical protein [Veillonella sp.]
MITDKQGREWVLQKLYDDGWRYIVGSLDDYVYITQREPTIVNGFFRSIGLCEIYKHIELKSVLPSLECGEVMNIAEELGIVDWSKVAVDTPILVKQYEQDEWEKRHFAYFKDGKVCAWLCGATSWSADYEGDTTDWNFVKLAEV